mgnify:CR=1 FL=1
MVREKPIKCPHCNKNTGYTQEQFMFYVVTSDILCPHCGEVIFHANGGIEFNTKQSSDDMHNPNVYTSTKNVNINTDLDY